MYCIYYGKPFVEVLRPLLRTVEEGLVPHDYRVKFRIEGDAGKLPAFIATPPPAEKAREFQTIEIKPRVDHH